jgi:hypothetical protein
LGKLGSWQADGGGLAVGPAARFQRWWWGSNRDLI